LQPITGTQFHPERNALEWKPALHIPHTADAIRAMQYIGRFIVASSAQSTNHSFASLDEENRSIMQNYARVYEGVGGVEIYRF
jgi:gamma-glutamyl hydrolase